ncbi:MAG TPA: nucleoside triphosphate pyrophosphohydrolase, partial [Chloroflexi bacterium]|nr:nucleoside triphosphate pyrophosphohydrolase [Chloroflexota bacterium]
MHITLLGLGPGDANLLTRQAWQTLQSSTEIYLRTRQHPVVQDLPANLTIFSFDDLYEKLDSFEDVYAQIVEKILELGQRPAGVLYAVPGHPLIAETTGPEILRRAREMEIPTRIVEGLSFLEPTFTALGLDPFPHTALVDALELGMAHHPPFPPDAPALIAQIYSRDVASDVKLTLMNLYPDEHPVKLIHAAGTEQQIIEDLPLYEIDRSPHIGLLTVHYLPPLGEYTSFESLQEITAHLRAPEGCPWDQEQTTQSLRPDLLEEAYEALAAIDVDDPAKMQEEFGDLLLMVAMLSQINSEEGDFNSADVIHGISTKLIRRHPHVFGDLAVDGVGTVLKNWEQIKAAERAANGEAEKSLLDGVSIAIPALSQAQEYQSRAARVGFDWPQIEGV